MAPSQAPPFARPQRELSQETQSLPPAWFAPRPPEQQQQQQQQQHGVTLPARSMTPRSVQRPCGPSTVSTPACTSAYTSAYTSLQSSPEGPRGRNLLASYPPTPLQLPDPLVATPLTPSHSAMADGVAVSKGAGLIRRISGAANKLRRRQSSNRASLRDQSSGPVMMRRRSESKSGGELDASVPGPAAAGGDGEDEELTEGPTQLHGLGFGLGLGFFADGPEGDLDGVPAVPCRTQGGVAPIVPAVLREGTTLVKVTKKKKQSLTFILDGDSARVSWNPSNPTKRFYVDDIQQIRLQGDAKNYREECQVSAEHESRWFTIVYADPARAKGSPVKTIHLIAPDQHLFEVWTSTLNDIARYRHDLMTGLVGSRQDDKTLQGHWNREMAKMFNGAPHTDDEENLDFPGIERLCRSLHINCSTNLLRAQFGKADPDETGYLSFLGFKDFVRRLKQRDEIKDIYKSLLAETAEGLTLPWFLGFLKHTQGIDVEANRAHWIKVFAKLVHGSSEHAPPMPDLQDESLMQMDLDAFAAFLSSVHNNIQASKAPEVKLDRPLNEYFISSSHNTYLLGRQVAGSSSVEAYIRALQKACRCVEIDCWDGPDGRPIVLHGRTMTSSVLFSDCIAVIGKYAFTASPYPLILSLEVHCNAEQQQTMVEIMIGELGERLVTEPYLTNLLSLPSPEELRYRILVKVKPGEDPAVTRPASPVRRRKRAFSSPFSRPLILDNSVVPNGPWLSSSPSMSPSEQSSVWIGGRSSTAATSMSSATDESDAHGRSNVPSRRSSTKHKSKIIKALGNLGVYTQGLKLNDFSAPESQTYNHVFSVPERRFENLCRDLDTAAQLEKHNMRYLMRVYPSAYRVKSTNPDPLAFWRRGAQMVALNWQTYDLGMQMNEAMFASGSDRSGYVLKPKELRHRSLSPPTMSVGNLAPTTSEANPMKLIEFSVAMISAQQLPQPRNFGPDRTLDPYIEIELFSAEDKAKGVAWGEGGTDASARDGTFGIGSPHRRRTRVEHSNGFNPIFNETFKLQLKTRYPDLVFVRWTVWNSQDGRNYNSSGNSEPLATFTAKLSSLEEGYRHLPLYDHNGDQFLFATLFSKVKKEAPVIIEHEDDPVAEKLGRFRQFGQSVFKRTLSMEKKNGKTEDPKSRKGGAERQSMSDA